MAHTDRHPYTPAPRASDAALSPGHVPAGVRTHGPQGTTHDPNSVTTGTEVEPTGDVYPPKGETEAEHRAAAASPKPADGRVRPD